MLIFAVTWIPLAVRSSGFLTAERVERRIENKANLQPVVLDTIPFLLSHSWNHSN
jgi:positive regulator of sigma E activity